MTEPTAAPTTAPPGEGETPPATRGAAAKKAAGKRTSPPRKTVPKTAAWPAVASEPAPTAEDAPAQTEPVAVPSHAVVAVLPTVETRAEPEPEPEPVPDPEPVRPGPDAPAAGPPPAVPGRPGRTQVWIGSAAALVVLALLVWGVSRWDRSPSDPVAGQPAGTSAAAPAGPTGTPSGAPTAAAPRPATGSPSVPTGTTTVEPAGSSAVAAPAAGKDGTWQVGVGDGVRETVKLVAVTSYRDPSRSGGRRALLGRFVKVTLQIVTEGTGSAPLDPMTDVYLRDSSGEQYLPFGMAAATEQSSSSLSARRLRAGTRLSGSVTFDVPDQPLLLVYAVDGGSRIVATWPIE